MVKKALIIAAGQGSRLRSDKDDLPKPLTSLAGLSLIERIILNSKKAGLSEFYIVVGFQKEKIIDFLKPKDLGVSLHFIENNEWEKANGVSVLKAKEYIKENFVLLMSDHIFDFETLQELRQAPLEQNKALLAVDYKLDEIFDIDDATKVKVKAGQIQKIDKELKEYNAFDTGMFLASPELFEALEEAQKAGKESLSDGIRILSEKNQMGAFDIKEGYWQDVDTPESLEVAEKHLIDSCRKDTDGVISRHINRPISLFISRHLLKTGLSANHVTGLTTLVGILSGVFVARADYWSVLLGAFLFQWASILDGCDGEISRMKLSSSKTGQWLDTLSDNFTYVCFFIGSIIAINKQAHPYASLMGTMIIFGLGMTLLVMFIYILKRNSGSLLSVQKDFQENKNQGLMARFFKSIAFMAKRDFFAFLFLILAALGRLDIILWLMLIGSNVIWMVLLSQKLGLFKSSSTNLNKEHKTIL